MLIESPSAPPKLLPLEEEGPARRAPRTRRWWHRKSTDVEILHRAVGVIDERGWTTGMWVNPEGQVCLLGAIGVAALESGRCGRRLSRLSFHDQVMVAADWFVGKKDAFQLHEWNDRLPYTGVTNPVHHVKGRLMGMAEKARINGGKYPHA